MPHCVSSVKPPLPSSSLGRTDSDAFEACADELESLVQPGRVLARAGAIYESDRWSTFSNYAATAAYLRKTFAQDGLDEIELEALPADGKTRFGDWIMPLAWDATDAELALLPAGGSPEVLARFADLPDALIMQSAPTDLGGVQADLIWMDEASPADWNGRIVLTEAHAQSVKSRLVCAGALGVVSFHHPFPEEGAASTYWYNTWSDKPGGWFANAGDTRLFGFSLAPVVGRKLRDRLRAGERLRVHARVNSRFYEGAMPFVSARIAGAGPVREEILVCAHLYEHGAHDNASGAACVLEIASILQAAIARGTLQRPARSLRFLLMPECYGTLAYATLRSERISRTRAGINLDGVGAGVPVRVIPEAPHCDAGLGLTLFERLKGRWGAANVRFDPVELCDNLLCDPAIGVPMVWPHGPCAKNTWHTSMDTLEVIHPDPIARMAGAIGAWMMELANREAITARSTRASEVPMPAHMERHSKVSWVPVRTHIGPLSLDAIPYERWPANITGSPRWYGWHTRAVWWADGTRTLAEIALLEKLTEPAAFERLVEYFQFLESEGLLKQRNTAVRPQT